jgi:glutathione S-transferase
MKLYTTALSPYSAKVRAALYEKKLAFEPIEVPFARAGFLSKPPELLRINPRGEVPVLIDGKVALYDSTVILEYLEDRYPDPALAPREPAARAVCRQLEDFCDELTGGPSADLVEELWTKTDPAARDAARIKQAGEAIQRAWARLDRQLEGRDWLCGAFSVADLSCFLPASYAGFVGHGPGEEHARLRAWIARMNERPSVARIRQEMLDAVKALAE